MQRSLEKNDTVINLRNQEIATLNSRLAAKDKIIEDAGEQINKLGSQLATERADREKVEEEPFDLKQKSVTTRELPGTVDLTEKAGELLNLFKSLLSPKAKLPSGTISKIEKILKE